MLTLTCNKCGFQSNNPFDFKNKRYSYIARGGALKIIHLCTSCQARLAEVSLAAVANFLGEPVATEIATNEGVSHV